MISLENIKVLDLSSVLAGPSVGMFFAELGADVLKIETPKGDVTRSWKLEQENPNSPRSAYFASVNWGKEILPLDLKDEDERQVVYHLVEEADIVITNFKAGDAEKLGVDYNILSQINPMLIYGAINGFGEGAKRPAFDLVLQAETGFMYMNGQSDGPATKMPVALIDVLAAHQLKEGILLALWRREREHKGAYVSVSLFDAAIAALANQASNYLMLNHLPQRMGSLHPNIAPYGEQFKTEDEQLVVTAIGSNRQFLALCQLIGEEQLAKDPRFLDNQNRLQNRSALAKLLAEAIGKWESQALLEGALATNVPLGLVRNMAQVFEQEAAQALILEEEPDGQSTKAVRTAVFKIKD